MTLIVLAAAGCTGDSSEQTPTPAPSSTSIAVPPTNTVEPDRALDCEAQESQGKDRGRAVRNAGHTTFDDTGENLALATGEYLLCLSKQNGAITGLVDRRTATHLTPGSRHGCLWGAVFPGAEEHYVGGCSFSAGSPQRFTYRWVGATNTLILAYSWDRRASRRMDATVEIVAYDAGFFDLRMSLRNEWGAPLERVLLPSDLMFEETQVNSAYGPFMLPGVRLQRGFFTEDRSYSAVYPGEAFAAYLALEVAQSHLALYTVTPGASGVQSVQLGFTDDPDAPGMFYSTYALQTRVADGEEWESPVVRVWIGAPARQTIQAYRRDNGIDDYPSLADKAGEKLEKLSKAPLVKADLYTVDRPFSAWDAQLDPLPSPSLLHLVAFQPGGFDANYPDFLPPDPRWGSTEDMAALADEVQARGGMVMPYTNPTWWVEGAPTLKQLPPSVGLRDIAVQRENGEPVYEEYSGHRGIVVSPKAPYVRSRLDRLMDDWRNDVPVDCVFFDQVGARSWLPDFNPSAPDPLAYSDGWLDFTRRYADRCLMTEMGWDRLAETMVAFHGSVLTWERTSQYASERWGAANWAPYPLALWLFHDKVLLYQHNLDGATMSTNRSMLTWNLAFGMMLSYAWERFTTDTLESDWLDLVALLQREVASRYAGERLTAYEELAAEVTRTRFGDLSIIANQRALPFTIDGYDVAASGFLARTEDRSLLAGVFSGGGAFNGEPLSPGVHYLLVNRSDRQLTVHQPVGPDTRIFLNLPAAWGEDDVQVQAIGPDGSPIESVEFWHWPEERRLSFQYRGEIHGGEVELYRVTPAGDTLPSPDQGNATGIARMREDEALLGALVYPQEGWGQTSPHTPALGHYDSSEPEVLRREINWMQRAGLDFALWQWIPDQPFAARVVDTHLRLGGLFPFPCVSLPSRPAWLAYAPPSRTDGTAQPSGHRLYPVRAKEFSYPRLGV